MVFGNLEVSRIEAERLERKAILKKVHAFDERLLEMKQDHEHNSIKLDSRIEARHFDAERKQLICFQKSEEAKVQKEYEEELKKNKCLLRRCSKYCGEKVKYLFPKVVAILQADPTVAGLSEIEHDAFVVEAIFPRKYLLKHLELANPNSAHLHPPRPRFKLMVDKTASIKDRFRNDCGAKLGEYLLYSHASVKLYRLDAACADPPKLKLDTDDLVLGMILENLQESNTNELKNLVTLVDNLPKNIMRYVRIAFVGMLNSNGGFLRIGVGDNCKVIGVTLSM